jgi:hypothetical protein
MKIIGEILEIINGLPATIVIVSRENGRLLSTHRRGTLVCRADSSGAFIETSKLAASVTGIQSIDGDSSVIELLVEDEDNPRFAGVLIIMLNEDGNGRAACWKAIEAHTNHKLMSFRPRNKHGVSEGQPA